MACLDLTPAQEEEQREREEVEGGVRGEDEEGRVDRGAASVCGGVE